MGRGRSGAASMISSTCRATSCELVRATDSRGQSGRLSSRRPPSLLSRLQDKDPILPLLCVANLSGLLLAFCLSHELLASSSSSSSSSSHSTST
eukprot:132347-Hanusia_phi.AAC.1